VAQATEPAVSRVVNLRGRESVGTNILNKSPVSGTSRLPTGKIGETAGWKARATVGNPALEQARINPHYSRESIDMRSLQKLWLILRLLPLLMFAAGCQTTHRPGTLTRRTGDEIVVAGRFVHTGTPVVLWMDPGGYDAYRVERRFSSFDESGWETSKFKVKDLSSPNRYNVRRAPLTPEQLERVRGGGWDLALLEEVVDQFVIHYDASGTSRQCFKVLHDVRGLSVHFMLDLDGTIYQTLDLKERAWHATSSNTRGIGIEIANIGAYPTNQADALAKWYKSDPDGKPYIVIPAEFDPSGVRTPGFIPRPARAQPITGRIQDQELVQYDFTPQQYAALIKLTAALCKVFPKLICDYPKNSDGTVVTHALPDSELERYQGVLGHYHIQTNKTDPGPAFQWNVVIDGARELMRRDRILDEKAASKLVRVRQ
jgi:N-acetyl-anhydromuramyl-L-alanine amidase AmpD